MSGGDKGVSTGLLDSSLGEMSVHGGGLAVDGVMRRKRMGSEAKDKSISSSISFVETSRMGGNDDAGLASSEEDMSLWREVVWDKSPERCLPVDAFDIALWYMLLATDEEGDGGRGGNTAID